jgi:hypothetical protein
MAKDNNESKVIAEWGGSHIAKVRVSLTTYKGRKLLAIRKHFDVANNGVLVPTRKGITLTLEEFPELQKAIRLVAKELKASESHTTEERVLE